MSAVESALDVLSRAATMMQERFHCVYISLRYVLFNFEQNYVLKCLDMIRSQFKILGCSSCFD
ncbi:Protein of unknown function [Cotesia congregata]|uniref:Uncharacterized protein n=1 Tax=Cotesia congregata TaxID=51543 RepID=A0A8J2MRA7_COTCN|nr:Protein of unknown function [Cotesia congregata]